MTLHFSLLDRIRDACTALGDWGGADVTSETATARNSSVPIVSGARRFKSSEEIQAARAKAAARAERADVWLGLVESPGTAGGPCTEACAHRYCILARATADSQCMGCRRPIGYGRQYLGDSNGLRHDACETRTVRLRRQSPSREPVFLRPRDEEAEALDKIESDDDTIHELADFHERARREA